MLPLRLRSIVLAVAPLALAAAGAFTGCSVERDQCRVDDDCLRVLGVASREFAQCTEGVCRPRDTSRPVALDVPCDTTRECTTDAGSPSVCHAGDQGRKTCVSLYQGGISEVTDNFLNGDPIFIGVAAPSTLVTPTGTFDSIFDKTNVDGTRLAADDWSAATAGAIQAGSARRPLTAVYCDTQGSADRLAECFDAMTTRLGAPIVMVHSDGDALAILPKAIARDVVVYCTDCEQANFQDTETAGHLWFGFPSATSTVPMRALWVEQLEAKIRTEQNRPTAPVKAMVLTSLAQPKTGAWLADAIRLNGKSAAENVAAGTMVRRVVDRGLPVDFDNIAKQAVTLEADIVVVENMGRDFHFLLMPQIEATWPNGKPRPRYVPGSDEGYAFRFQRSVGANDELRSRVTGVTYWTSDPQIDANQNAYFQAFQASSRLGYDPAGLASGFEAFYVAAYAITSAVHMDTVNPAALHGADVIKGIQSLIAAPGSVVVDVRASDIPRGVAALSAKQRIDLRGVNSSLDWGPHGEIYADAAAYCVKPNFSLKEFWIYNSAAKAPVASPDLSVCQF